MNRPLFCSRMTLVAGLALFGSLALAGERVVKRDFPLNEGGALSIKVSGADVKVGSGADDKVRITATIRGSDRFLDQYKVFFDADPDRIAVTDESPRFNWSMGSRSIRFTIEVPRRSTLTVRTSGGDISVTDVIGTTDLRTSGGDINIDAIKGNLVASTSGGDIEARSIEGDKTLRTSGGNIEVRNASGRTEARTSGGNLNLVSLRGPVMAKTSGGNITIEMEGRNEGVEARTSGGNIRLYSDPDLNGNLYAKSSGGAVKCDFPVTIEGRIRKNLVQGKLNDGGADITLITSGGGVRIASR